MKTSIKDISAIEILDSRGNPTVCATVTLEDGSIGRASVPSGASVGKFEACELRDGDPSRFGGKGVLRAIQNITDEIKPRLLGEDAVHQGKIDKAMCELDSTENKSRLGANAILATSLATSRAAASSLGLPLYKYLAEYIRLDNEKNYSGISSEQTADRSLNSKACSQDNASKPGTNKGACSQDKASKHSLNNHPQHQATDRAKNSKACSQNTTRDSAISIKNPNLALPCPMMNILNGGAHAPNNLEIQEFMIAPIGICDFSEKLRAGAEIYFRLGKILKSRGLSTSVGDEGGFAPSLSSDEEACELICEAILSAGYTTDKVKLALDVAASEWYSDGKYLLKKGAKTMLSEELIEYFDALVKKYPIFSIEDGLGDDDTAGWQVLTARLGGDTRLVGDDLFVTNEKRLNSGISQKIANAILIKPNQIGTLTETATVISRARESDYISIASHRSGDTEDSYIADLSVGLGTKFIKSGAPCRSERLAKYNRLLEIEKELS